MRHLLPLLLLGATALSGATAQTTPGLLVAGYNSNAVHRYDETSFASTGAVGAVAGAQSMRYGPNGDLFVPAEKNGRIIRFDATTGARSRFVFDDPATPGDETGGLQNPTSAIFGTDGKMYVGDFAGDSVLRYDGATGAYLDVFVASSRGGLNGPDAGMTFGPDGHLYVPSFNTDAVLRFDGTTGAWLGDFIPAGSGGLSRPRMLRFHSDGRLYVSSWASNRILRYSLDGTFIDEFATSQRPTGMVFRPDTGDLLVCSDATDTVRQYDAQTGAFKGLLVGSGSGGLNGATFLEYYPDRALHQRRLTPGQVGVPSSVGVDGAAPSAALLLLAGTGSLPRYIAACPAWIGVDPPIAVPLFADPSGSLTLSLVPPPALLGMDVVTQFAEPAACRTSSLGLTRITP
ncbi:MAG: hypothetical protein AAF628_38125 [Planctomycetota bacterium]